MNLKSFQGHIWFVSGDRRHFWYYCLNKVRNPNGIFVFAPNWVTYLSLECQILGRRWRLVAFFKLIWHFLISLLNYICFHPSTHHETIYLLDTGGIGILCFKHNANVCKDKIVRNLKQKLKERINPNTCERSVFCELQKWHQSQYTFRCKTLHILLEAVII